jgi:KipI family sensor histidine kinase inhibitor
MSSVFRHSIAPYGERGWIARLHDVDDEIAAALYVNAVADALRMRAGVTDSVAGVDSLVIRVDPALAALAATYDWLTEALRSTPATVPAPKNKFEIPVCYGGEYGADLDDLGKRASLSSEQLIAIHTARPYRVLTVGFAPGFAYLGPLDEALRMSRLETPRPRVAAGSVGVAGGMTGVYPLASPGGWRIIGRTPVKLFHSKAGDPFKFSPGDEVRFIPISAEKFEKIADAQQ